MQHHNSKGKLLMSLSHRVGSLAVIPAVMYLIVAVKSMNLARVLFAEENAQDVIKAGEINGV